MRWGGSYRVGWGVWPCRGAVDGSFRGEVGHAGGVVGQNRVGWGG